MNVDEVTPVGEELCTCLHGDQCEVGVPEAGFLTPCVAAGVSGKFSIV